MFDMLKRKGSGTGGSRYRFNVGTQVICRTGQTEWSAGVIVALDYSESYWPPGKTVPYQVQLNKGPLIFVPQDTDQLCQKLVPPWWASCFKKSKTLYAEYNPSAEVLAKEAAGQNINLADHEGKTALVEAVEKTWPNAVAQLLSLKADPNIARSDKTCAIHLAATEGKDMVKMLVDAKADLNVQDQDPDYDPEFTSTTFGDRLEHRTALHYACADGDAEAAKVLLEGKAEVDMRDAQYKTPLHLAIESEQGDCVDVLLSFGTDMDLGNQSSGMETSALMDAAAAGKTELVKKLIAAKANINKQGKQQLSALHLAARSRRAEVCELLLAAKADMNQESNLGSALQLARKNGGSELLKVFGDEADTPAPTSISTLDAAQRAALFLE